LWSDALVLIGDMPVERDVRLSCYQGAVEKCRRAVELTPREWDAYNRWGSILTAKLSEFAINDQARIQFQMDAARLFSNAVERAQFSGDVGTAYASWGASLVRAARLVRDAGRKEKLLRQAIDKFGRAEHAVPRGPASYTMCGSAMVQLGKVTHLRNDFRDAINQFETSLSLRPNDPSTLYALACAHALTDNPIITVETLKKCFAVDSSGSYRKIARQDPDLADLREDPGFQELFSAPIPRRGVSANNPPLRDDPY